MYNEMSVTFISVSHDTVVSNKHEERTRHYYVIFQHVRPLESRYSSLDERKTEGRLMLIIDLHSSTLSDKLLERS